MAQRPSNRPTGPLVPSPEPSSGRVLSPGTMLGPRYKILSVLGTGGMGVVYRALDMKLDQEIALKRLRPDRISNERREILRREIILSRRVTHENVCRIYDLEEFDGEEFVSMEYLRGEILKDIEEHEGVIPLGRGIQIAKGICRGLSAAHRIGVLHRDLKPENVLIDLEGRPRLMDFGIAIDRNESWSEKSGTVPGTPQFLAPELLRGAAPDVRTDLYALGILFYEMFTGRVPFDDPDTAALVRKILEREAPPVTALRPEFPAELSDIIARTISKDPAARFASADEIAAALESYEGIYLDRALKEVSVARARSVKLMVILEANKALAATFDPTKILQIILKTATDETDAERGTIFLVEGPEKSLVSQILEGGTVAQIRLPWGHGIAGACAAECRPILTRNVDADPRHDRGADSSSGFKTLSILAVPMKTPSGEVVGVLEVLNKRRNDFSKEDEEFLINVAEHAALAVASSRSHREAVAQAGDEVERRIFHSLHPLLSPSPWPSIEGIECEPLRWSSTRSQLVAYGAVPGDHGPTIFLLEDDGEPADRIGQFIGAVAEARAQATAGSLPDLADAIRQKVARFSAARFDGSPLECVATEGLLPSLYRGPRGLEISGDEINGMLHGKTVLDAGDLLLMASSGLQSMSANQGGARRALGLVAALCSKGSLAGAFTETVAGWKRSHLSPADIDVVLLGARRR